MKLLAATVCLLATASISIAASIVEPEFPKTTQGERAQAFFDAFNSGDPEQHRAFIETHRVPSEEQSVEQRLERFAQFATAIGHLEPKRVSEADDAVIVIAHSAQAQTWIQFTMSFEPDGEHRLVEIRAVPSADPALTEMDLGEWQSVHQLLESVRQEAGVPALAAAVVRGDEVIDHASIGVRRAGGSSAVTDDDSFQIGSITKSVTATMIARLVELDVLSWDTTIGEALPDMEMRDEYADVTLAQLLYHRAGVRPYTDSRQDELPTFGPDETSLTEQRAKVVAQILAAEPVGPRGETHLYSNAGYTIAGLIAERATKLSWEELIDTHVFEALAMESASFGYPADSGLDQPHGHIGAGPFTPIEADASFRIEGLAPAGNVSCTIEDLARYAAGHLSGLNGKDNAVTAGSYAFLHTAPAEATGDGRYACGWVLFDGPRPHHWHNGSAGTFYAEVAIYPELDLAVAVATNVGPGPGRPLAEMVRQRLVDRYAGSN